MKASSVADNIEANRGAGNKVLLFCRGKIIKTIDAAGADDAFAEALENL